MSHVPHELPEALPEYAEAIAAARASNAHFARLADEYHEVNREIHRAETNLQPTEDLYIVEMRKRRLALLDELRRMLAQAA